MSNKLKLHSSKNVECFPRVFNTTLMTPNELDTLKNIECFDRIFNDILSGGADIVDGELVLGEADEISNHMVDLNSSNIEIINHTLVIE